MLLKFVISVECYKIMFREKSKIKNKEIKNKRKKRYILDQGVIIQEVYDRCVREIILHVHKGGVDLPDRKKIKF